MSTAHQDKPPPAAAGASKFSFGAPSPTRATDTAEAAPTTQQTPDPAPSGSTATAPTPSPAGPARVRPAPSGPGDANAPGDANTSLRRPSDSTDQPSSGQQRARVAFDYAAHGPESKVKDPGGVISRSLQDQLQQALPQWATANWDDLAARGLKTPTTSGFREALLRLGLKYIDDPEFIALIPPDGRRRGARDGLSG